MKKRIVVILFAVMLGVPSLLIAQDPPDFPPDTEDVPLDGGVSVLVAAGVAYGLKKIHDHKKQKNYSNAVK